MLGRDGWAGLVVLAASLFLFGMTLELRGNPMVPIGPGFYPRIVLGLTAVLAAALAASAWFARRKRAPAPAHTANYRLVLLMFAVFGLYCGALPYLGFRVATFAYVAGTNAILAPPRGARGWLRAALTGFVATVVVYYLFEHYLSVLLPRGRWTDF